MILKLNKNVEELNTFYAKVKNFWKGNDMDYTKQELIKLLKEDTKPETILFLDDKDFGTKIFPLWPFISIEEGLTGSVKFGIFRYALVFAKAVNFLKGEGYEFYWKTSKGLAGWRH